MGDARTFEAGRYRKRPEMYLDHDDGGYINSFAILDGQKETGITVCDSGHSMKGSHKRSVRFKGADYALVRDAIFAYEDALTAGKAQNNQ